MQISLSSIRSCTHLRGKRVLVRAGLDVPMTNEGVITDDFRIKQSLSTLHFLRDAGARVIILAHGSRPDGSSDISLHSVCDALNVFMPVLWAGAVVGDVVEEKIAALQDGDLLLLENLRFEKGEKENDEAFAKTLASYGDMYVNDAFSVAHRTHASIVGIPQFLPSYAGISFVEEVENLTHALAPQSPSLFILCGAKFDTKLPLVEKLLSVYDKVFIGGALADNFFVAQGFSIGKSLVSDLDITKTALFNNPKILLPIDVVVNSPHGREEKKPDAILSDEAILDAGSETIAMLQKEIESAATILWNGPLGDYEHGFDAATKAVAESIARAKGTTIVGGGDTIAAINNDALTKQFTFLSTAGGAMLTFLEEGTLPGIEALVK